MAESQFNLCLNEKCKVLFEKSLISKELIIQRYTDYFTNAIISKEHSSIITLHTGSICFDIISFIIVTLACITYDQTDTDEIINALNIDDMILYKNQRHRWLGLDIKNGIKYMILEKDGIGKDGPTKNWLLFDKNKALIKPYYGNSEMTDGRGIKKEQSDRSDFIEFVTGREKSDVPSITGVSVVIVINRYDFDRIQKGLVIEYDNDKSIGLLDIVPASYYTSVDESYQFGSNPSKVEPVLKITSKISIARDLVLTKEGNKVIGLVVLGENAAMKGTTELEDLLNRKSLYFKHISMSINSLSSEGYIDDGNSAVFACTKEFLLQNSLPPVSNNSLVIELEKQIKNIINNEISVIIVEGGFSWEDYQKIKKTLCFIKQSEWDEGYKKQFIITAYSLLNLLITSVFPMKALEQDIYDASLHLGVLSPSARIKDLWNLAEKANSLEMQCIFVANALDDLYQLTLLESPKHQSLKELVEELTGQKIAIIIPKAYYKDLLEEETVFKQKNLHIITANRFDSSNYYDKIIVIGDFISKRFDSLKCRASSEIIILLYECETYWFRYRKQRNKKFEKKLNAINGIDDGFLDDDLLDFDINDTVEQFVGESLNLDEYIEKFSIMDAFKFNSSLSSFNSSSSVIEVSTIGRFISGEHILFSKNYKAVAYNQTNDKDLITEVDVDKLSSGDRLIFTKHDNFTRNIVDIIYEALQISGKLSKDILDATEKAKWWKEVLRVYQSKHDLSYKQLEKELNRCGCFHVEASIRQWLVEDSHIVGPQKKITLKQIGDLTKDVCLINNTSEYFNACRAVRRQRKRILTLIGKAIEDKLSGNQPLFGSELEIIYNNVDNLSEILELETVTSLDEPFEVPTYFINKPIPDMEET